MIIRTIKIIEIPMTNSEAETENFKENLFINENSSNIGFIVSKN